MKNFLRENPTIAFGLGLPVLLVVLFLAVSGIPTLLVAPARYDVIYATGINTYNSAQQGFQIAVVGDRVKVNYLGNTQPYQTPQLWRFTPKTGAVKEIPLLLPPGLAPNTGRPPEASTPPAVTPIELPDLAALKVDSSSLAPDGYRFSTGEDGYAGPGFPGLFYGSRYRLQAELVKNGRSIRLPNTEGAYYGNSVRFIGWVVAP